MEKGNKGVAVFGIVIAALGLGFLLTRKKKVTPPPPPPTGLANLYGLVTDTAGRALAGANLLLDSRSAVSGSDGSYAISNIEPGEYAMTINLTGYETLTVVITLVEGSHRVDFQLIPIVVPPTLPSASFWGALVTPTTVQKYVAPEIGWCWIIDKFHIGWKNTGNQPFKGYMSAVVHPYAYGAAGFCSDQSLIPVQGQGQLVNPGETGTVVFSSHGIWGGVLSVRITDEAGNVAYQSDPWDSDTQRGEHFNWISAPGGAVNPEDLYTCPI